MPKLGKDILLNAVFVVVLSSCVQQSSQESQPSSEIAPLAVDTLEVETKQVETKRIDFSTFDSSFRFSGEVPLRYEVEYIPEIVALNIYDPAIAASSKREQSQIFIRFFEANSFLTLSTVTIHSREETKIGAHAAVRYEIEKKPSIAAFADQPSWRSSRHQLVDIRLTSNNPSLFYVFAYNPTFSATSFEEFLDSLIFHHDLESLQSPMDRAQERVTLLPFGRYTSPGHSPVGSDRFTGYHTAIDFEILETEMNEDVEVVAFCSGPLRVKRFAPGYGGVLVQECTLEDQPVTVIYGHVDLASVNHEIGDVLAPGDLVGRLGDHESEETDGERKHLHFGIHKGTEISIIGYVGTESALEDWIDPMPYVTR